MKKQKSIEIKKNPGFPVSLDVYFGQQTLERSMELYDKINLPCIKRLQTGITGRVLNWWFKEHLIESKESKVRRFTFTEFVWIRIIEQLRIVGCSFQIIKAFRQYLLAPIEAKGVLDNLKKFRHLIDDLKLTPKQREQLLGYMEAKEPAQEREIHILHLLIMEAIIKRLPLSIAIFTNGSYVIIDKSKEHLYTDSDREKLAYEPYAVVSIAMILREFLVSDLSGFVLPTTQLLSYPENKLFEVIHSGDYESITIHFKDKKPKSLELKKSEDIKRKIVDILAKGEFGEIVVKKHKGVIAKIENTEKIHL